MDPGLGAGEAALKDLGDNWRDLNAPWMPYGITELMLIFLKDSKGIVETNV